MQHERACACAAADSGRWAAGLATQARDSWESAATNNGQRGVATNNGQRSATRLVFSVAQCICTLESLRPRGVGRDIPQCARETHSANGAQLHGGEVAPLFHGRQLGGRSDALPLFLSDRPGPLSQSSPHRFLWMLRPQVQAAVTSHSFSPVTHTPPMTRDLPPPRCPLLCPTEVKRLIHLHGSALPRACMPRRIFCLLKCHHPNTVPGIP